MSFSVFLQYLLPKHILSRLVGKFATCHIPMVKNFLISIFCSLYQVDMSEALEPNKHNYPTFNDFFVRELKPSARSIASDPNKIISPVDGKIWQIGKIDDNQLIHAKGKGFTLEQLLADKEDAQKFQNGNFSVLYLAPHNYHRIHMPIAGKLVSMRYIPGNLFSVSPKVVNHIPDLFARNERVVAIFDTEIGEVAVIFVGAVIVGSIETSWEGVITPNQKHEIKNWDYQNKNISFERGAEIGRFNLGSTVILLFPENYMSWNQNLKTETPINMGQELGQYR